jgi:trehalose 6-phosphate synthase/phosphatase
MSRLLIVSNRLPITVIKRKDTIKFQSSVGGLATGLDSFYKSYNSLWLGWPGIAIERIKKEKRKIEKKLTDSNCYPVFLSQHDIDLYYRGFCNKTIWPLFHYFTQHTMYSKNLWEAYKKVNEKFCEIVSETAKPGDRIWIHDYQLMLLPKLLRNKNANASIGFFLHIPFPSSEVFCLCPYRAEIIEGILGADLIGFHTHDYVHHFTETIRRVKGYEHSMGQITVGNRIIKVDAFPMGIDYERFHEASNQLEIQKEIGKIRSMLGDRKIIVSIDRLDYTKGIVERLQAFEYFLEKCPEYRKKVTLILVAVPSRTSVEHYILLKKQVDELISRINGRYGDIGWVPIWYLYRLLSFPKLVALYSIADVALITPIRDGMNLIAKEFIASKADATGVLILGEMAGAAKELGEAITVNTHNKEEIAEAIRDALTMSGKEQIRRNKVMQKRLQRYNVERWAHDFMDRLHQIKKIQNNSRMKRLNPELKKRLINDYARSKSRLLLLDYDGTMVSFTRNPDDARPDQGIKRILEKLTHNPRNEVVIVSGRRKNTLENWFGEIGVGLIAEHGVWIKKKNKNWQMIEPLSNEWKKQIKPVIDLYTDRTPGSFIEEKEYSLVWHYRKADPKLALIRAGELKEALTHLTSSLDLGILEGSKVIEIKNTGINKGRAALKWISGRKWGFILAIGDDWTDEDIFSILPRKAHSIKVGYGISKARFNIDYPDVVRALLKNLAAL